MIDAVRDNLGKGASDVLARLLIIAAILAGTWLVERLVNKVLPRLIRLLTPGMRSDLESQLTYVLLPPIRLLVTVIGFWLAVITLELPDRLERLVPPTFNSLAAIALFWVLYRGIDLLLALARRVSRRTLGSDGVSDKLALAVRQVGRALIILITGTIVLEEFDYNVGGLVAGLGIGGLAVALAAQDALANLIGYFVILADEPFVIGDYIVVSGVSGKVEGLGFRSTLIRVLDQSLVSVPNKLVTSSTITNWSRLARRRLNMTLKLSLESSPQQVLAVVQQIRLMLQSHPLVQRDSVIVQFVEFGDNALEIMVICFMETPDWADFQAARQDINLKIMLILNKYRVMGTQATHLVIEQEAAVPEIAKVTFPPPRPEPTTSTVTDSPVPKDAAN